MWESLLLSYSVVCVLVNYVLVIIECYFVVKKGMYCKVCNEECK